MKEEEVWREEAFERRREDSERGGWGSKCAEMRDVTGEHDTEHPNLNEHE
jgi:hypothetical protein